MSESAVIGFIDCISAPLRGVGEGYEHSAPFADSSLKSFGTIVQYFFPISPKVLSMARLMVRVGS
jgi:hypothetical protein